MSERMNRRRYLVGSAASIAATAALSTESRADGNAVKHVYLHGQAWNTDLPGEAGDLILVFDIWADLDTGTGLGTASDSIHPNANIQFDISTASLKGDTLTLQGNVIRANDPNNIGLPIGLIGARLNISGAPRALHLGDLVFNDAGIGLVDGSVRVVDGTSNTIKK